MTRIERAADKELKAVNIDCQPMNLAYININKQL